MLFLLQELIRSQANILTDLPKQNGRDIAPLVIGNCCLTAIAMAELLMRATLANLGETERFETRNDFPRFQHR